MNIVFWALLLTPFLITCIGVYLYNSIVALENRVDNAWSQISVQLKRRSDLIPNILEIAKQYAEHEQAVFQQVSAARTKLENASSPVESATASKELTAKLGGVFAVAEDYPDLKSDRNFRQVQEELSSTENKIAYARQHYNDVVTAYNTRLEIFPSNIIANMFTFNQRELFQESDQEID